MDVGSEVTAGGFMMSLLQLAENGNSGFHKRKGTLRRVPFLCDATATKCYGM
jgi:hypothetical protein